MSERLQQSSYEAIVELALAEDIGTGDITARALADEARPAVGRLIARQDLVLCGVDVARHVFRKLDPDCRFPYSGTDGTGFAPDQEILVVEGDAACMLIAERTALNFLQRLSGVSTLVSQYVAKISHTKAQLVDTRKTTPGMRELQKYAVRCGGGGNHRSGLFDGILIKENHIRTAGSISAAVEACRKGLPHLMKIEVEVSCSDELQQALDAGAEVVMLDNFSLKDIRRAVDLNAGRALLEVSGNVDLQSIGSIADCGVDIISVGRLTHSAPAVDLSMLFDL